MKKKTYTITVAPNWMSRLLDELQNWQVPPASYTIRDNTITTNSATVIGVATETFLRLPKLIKIEVA